MARLINNTQGYTIVTQNITMDKRLGIKERGMMLTLLSLPNNWEFSVIGLTKILPDGKAAIQSAVQKLEECGYLKRVQAKGDNGKFIGYDWEIIAQPTVEAPLTENRSTAENGQNPPLTENRSTEKRSTEKRSTEKRSTENQPQLNTNLSITNELNTNSINNQSIYPTAEEDIKRAPAKLEDRLIDRDLIEKIKNQIQYEDFVRNNKFDTDNANFILDGLAQMYVANKPMKFNGAMVDPQAIRDRAAAFRYDHIGYVIDRVTQQAGKIDNLRGYILTCVYNAPVDFGMHEDRGYFADIAKYEEEMATGGTEQYPVVDLGPLYKDLQRTYAAK